MHPEANIIIGAVIDHTLGVEVRVTVSAAGFDGGDFVPKPLAERRTNFVEAAVPVTVGAETTDVNATGSFGPGGWGAEPDAPAVAAPRDRDFDDDDDLDVPDFLK